MRVIDVHAPSHGASHTDAPLPRGRLRLTDRGLLIAFGAVAVGSVLLLFLLSETARFERAIRQHVTLGFRALATQSFLEADDAFAASRTLLRMLSTDPSFAPPATVRDGITAISLAQQLTATLADLSAAVTDAEQPLQTLFTFPTDGGASLTAPLRTVVDRAETLFPLLADASSFLARLDHPRAQEARAMLINLTEQFTALHIDAQALLALFGDAHPQTFLLVFQNDAERRPTGGFIGSLGLFTMNDGYRSTVTVRDVYDFDGQLAETIPPPDEVRRLTDAWQLRDSNVSPDFSISAEYIRWFFEKEGGQTVDHVVAITPEVLRRILAVTGPITIPKVPFALTHDNVDRVLQALVEAKAVSAAQPKAVLSSLMAALEERLSDASVMDIVPALLQEKQLLLFSRHPSVQAFFEKLGGTGRMLLVDAPDDYLSVVMTSIGGNKSDAYMKESVRHTTFLKENGVVMNEVRIYRHHAWDAAAARATQKLFSDLGLSPPSPTLLSILGGGDNRSFVRVYVPWGAELEYASGVRPDTVEVLNDPQLSKTFFRYVSEVSPGEGETVTLRYRLPPRAAAPLLEYRFHVQKQPGTPGFLFKKDIVHGDERVIKLFPDLSWKKGDDRVQAEILLEQDTMFAGLFQG